MLDESNAEKPLPTRHNKESFLNASATPTTPSTATVLAVLGGCLFAAVLVIGVVVLGIAFFVQQQRVWQAREMAEAEQQRAAELQAYHESVAKTVASRNAAEAERAVATAEKNEIRRQATDTLIQEQRARVREVEQQSRMRLEQQKLEDQARRGFELIQTALFKNININDPESVLAPSPLKGAGLSWRVHLLPELGFKALHNEFHLDEPWDSAYNKTLISKMPSVFGLEPQNGLTQIRSFLRLDGDGGAYTRVGDVHDGLEQTALLFHVGESQAITWTQPDNVHEFIAVTPERLGLAEDKAMRYSLCGYQTIWSAMAMPPEVLQALSTPAGGEHLDDELIAGQWTGPAAAVRVATLVTSNEAVEPLSRELQSSQAHEKLRQISEALTRRELQLKQLAGSQPATRSPLSWRVHLLPFLGHEELFRQFDLSQPWNSEANLPLASKMPDIFRIGSFGGRTRFILSLPKDCKRAVGQLPAAGAITDAPELTTLIYLAAPHRGVTWTRPDSMEPMTGTPQHSLGWANTTSVIAATFAGSTLEIPGNLHPSKIAALISTHRGETFELSLALKNPEQQLRLAPVIRPAEPVPDLILLPKLLVETDALKPAELPKDSARFRSLYIAVHSFYDAYRQSPAHVQSPNGVRSQLSWRVHLLPFMKQQPLYDRFRFDEPWDSEHNLSLLEFMPDVFRSSSDAASTTRLRVLSGNGSLFAANKRWTQTPDGNANTIMILEAGDPYEQKWTKPDTDIELSSLDFSGLFGNSIEIKAMMGGGQVLRFTKDTPVGVFRALATANGNELVDAATVQRWLAHQRGETLMVPQVETRWETQQMSNIVLATINHHDIHHFFPPQQRNDAKDTITLRSSQLSWRVHILPFLGQSALYKQFRLEEPWDSPHNLQLLSSMPDCYRDANDLSDSSTTRIVRIVGPGTSFPEIGLAPTMRDIKDGTSQTLHFIQAPEDDAVPWTRPDDLLVNVDDPDSAEFFQRLASTPALKTVTFDGAVRRLAPNVSAETLKGLITPSGSELLKTREVFLEN